MSMKRVIAELIASSVIEKIKDEAFGIMLKDLPRYSYKHFLEALYVQIDEHNLVKPYICFVGFSKEEIISLKNEIKEYMDTERTYFTVEDAEKFRNDREIRATRIVIVKRDVPKLSSLRWYEKIQTEELYDNLCLKGMKDFGIINDALKNLWAALKYKAIKNLISLESLVNYYEYFIKNDDNITEDAISQMYKLGLLIDDNLFENTKRQSIVKRIINNKKTVLRISQLDTGDQKALQARDTDDAHIIRANILNYYKTKENRILSNLKYIDVLSILSNVNKKKRKKNEKDRKEKGNKEYKMKKRGAESVGVDLIIGHETNKIKDILEEIEDKYNTWDKGKGKKINIDDNDVSIKLEFIKESYDMIETFVSENAYGGLILADEVSPVDALNSISKKKIEVFDNNYIQNIQNILKALEDEFEDTSRIVKTFNDFIGYRTKMVKYSHRLADSPILKIVETEETKDICINYINTYSNLMRLIRDKYSIFEAYSREGTKELVIRINSLDTVYIVGSEKVHAILTPLNPLYLWKYVELVRRLSETTSDLDDSDKDFLVRAADNIPNQLNTVFVSNFITNKDDFVIPEIGYLGKLPMYSNERQVNQVTQGLDNISNILKKFTDIYQHSRVGLRIAFVNPPNIKSVFEVIKDLINDEIIQGSHIHIYRTKESSYNWSSFENIDDNLLSYFGLSQFNNYSVKIHSQILTFKRLIDELKKNKFHVTVLFDAANKAIINSKREPRLKLKIHPLCVPNVFKYDPITDKLEISPSTEGNIFADYHDLIAKLNDKPRGWHHTVALESQSSKEEYKEILENTIWLIIADEHLKRLELTTIGSNKCIYYKTNTHRDIGVYSEHWTKLTNSINHFIRSIGNYNPKEECLDKVLKRIKLLNEKGILHLTSSSTDSTFDNNHTKGAVGLAISSFFYNKIHRNSILVSLDTDLAQSWLEEREDKIFSDLVGIRYDGQEAFIDVIEVKTYKDYTISEAENGVREIVGNAVNQVNAMYKIINEIFFEQDKITSTSRKEILRYQLFTTLHQMNLSRSEKKMWTEVLNDLFAGNLKVNINLNIHYIHFNDQGITNDKGIECHSINKIKLYEIKNDIINEIFNNCEKLKTREDISQLEKRNSTRNKSSVSTNNIIEINDKEEQVISNDKFKKDNKVKVNEANEELNKDVSQELDSGIEIKNDEKSQKDEDNNLMENGSEVREFIENTANSLLRAMKDYSIDVAEIDPKKALVASRFIRFRVRLRPGETLQKVLRFRTDIAREIEAESDILVDNERGSQYIYVDVPRKSSKIIKLLDYTKNIERMEVGNLNVIVGQEPSGKIEFANIAKAPHILTAGSTGSGKTIFLYSILVSLLTQYNENELEIVIIDPKQTDFIFFEGLPHLRDGKVIIDAENAVQILTDLVENELEARTNLLRESRSRDLFSYNKKNPESLMKPILVIIDEYADLVQAADLEGRKDDFERNIIRLAQRSRNVGIHLVIATQRPSADIVTSRLKANIPTRISFRLPAHQDSQTILDTSGAQDLLGQGDMLYSKNGELKRLQGLYISEEELEKYLANKYNIRYD